MATARFSLTLACPMNSARRCGRSFSSNEESSSTGAAETMRSRFCGILGVFLSVATGRILSVLAYQVPGSERSNASLFDSIIAGGAAKDQMKDDSRKHKPKRKKVNVNGLLSRVDSLPTLNPSPEDEILGYNEDGTPESSPGDRTVSQVANADAAARWPDFAARRKRILGARVIPIVDDLIKNRGR